MVGACWVGSFKRRCRTCDLQGPKAHLLCHWLSVELDAAKTIWYGDGVIPTIASTVGLRCGRNRRCAEFARSSAAGAEGTQGS